MCRCCHNQCALSSDRPRARSIRLSWLITRELLVEVSHGETICQYERPTLPARDVGIDLQFVIDLAPYRQQRVNEVCLHHLSGQVLMERCHRIFPYTSRAQAAHAEHEDAASVMTLYALLCKRCASMEDSTAAKVRRSRGRWCMRRCVLETNTTPYAPCRAQVTLWPLTLPRRSQAASDSQRDRPGF